MKQPSNDDAPTSGLKHAMPDDPGLSPRRLLEPNERIAEVIFGLIMVLTFTGSLSVTQSGRAEIRTMLAGALGCNVAWGIIDGVFYLMGCLAEKHRSLLALRAVRRAGDPEKAHRVIAQTLPVPVASILKPAELETIRVRLKDLPEPPERVCLGTQDWLGAVAVFALVFLSTFPVVVPFICMSNIQVALRASNGIAVLMLFLMGRAFGRSAGFHPWGTGAAMVLLGILLVAITMALGG